MVSIMISMIPTPREDHSRLSSIVVSPGPPLVTESSEHSRAPSTEVSTFLTAKRDGPVSKEQLKKLPQLKERNRKPLLLTPNLMLRPASQSRTTDLLRRRAQRAHHG